MRTMADAQRAEARRNNQPMPIYGDPNLGSYGGEDYSKFEYDVDPNYKTKWPAGYWEKYESLKAEAQSFSQAIALHMVVMNNGRYRVYVLMPVGIGKSGPTHGPEHHDRNGAWEAFIGTFVKIETLNAVSRQVKLPEGYKPPEPVLVRAKLAVKMDDLKGHDAWAQKAAPAFDKPLTAPGVTKHVPEKGRKGRRP